MSEPTPAAQGIRPVIAVRGEVRREVEPELATFGVYVTSRDKDRPESLRRLVARLDAVRAVLDEYARVVEKRENSSLVVHPEVKRGEKVTGYSGQVNTMVTVTDFAELGPLMLRLADLEQTTVAGPWWSLRPDSPAYRDARRAAIGDALVRARDYAEAVGARLTHLIEIADSDMSGGMVPLAYRGFAGPQGGADQAGGLPELDLEPARQMVTAVIEARFAISEPTILDRPAQ